MIYVYTVITLYSHDPTAWTKYVQFCYIWVTGSSSFFLNKRAYFLQCWREVKSQCCIIKRFSWTAGQKLEEEQMNFKWGRKKTERNKERCQTRPCPCSFTQEPNTLQSSGSAARPPEALCVCICVCVPGWAQYKTVL